MMCFNMLNGRAPNAHKPLAYFEAVGGGNCPSTTLVSMIEESEGLRS